MIAVLIFSIVHHCLENRRNSCQDHKQNNSHKKQYRKIARALPISAEETLSRLAEIRVGREYRHQLGEEPNSEEKDPPSQTPPQYHEHRIVGTLSFGH
jgi:hypothetical protein